MQRGPNTSQREGRSNPATSSLRDQIRHFNRLKLTQWFYSSSKGQSTKQNQKVPNEPYLLYSYQTPPLGNIITLTRNHRVRLFASID